MELEENQFYQGELSDSVAVTEVAAKDYYEALEALSPTVPGGPGLFGQFMEQTDLWALGMQPVAGASVVGAATTPRTFEAAMSPHLVTGTCDPDMSLRLCVNELALEAIATWKCAVGGLPTGNAANKPGGRFNVPVQVAYWDESKSNSYASFIPRQDAQMAIDGFECTGNSCTVADGSTYSFSLTSDSGRDAAGWSSLSVN